MSCLFLDSFDHYATADATQKWTSKHASATIGANGRNSTNGMRFTSFNNSLVKNVGNQTDGGIIGFAINVATNFGPSNNPILTVRDGATAQISVGVTPGGTIRAWRNVFNNTTLGTASAGLALGIWAYIEVKFVIHNTTGSIVVRKDGIEILNLTNIDTQDSGTNQWNDFYFVSGNNDTTSIDIDDVYVCTTGGSVNNDFIGPLRVKAVLPDGAGTTTNFTPSAGSNFQNVDDTSTDGDTTYNSETTAGELDLYTYAAVGVTGTVKALQTNLMVRSDGAGSETIAPMVRISGVNYTGTTAGVSTSYSDKMQVYDTSPASATAWTTAEIDGAEFGIKLVS